MFQNQETPIKDMGINSYNELLNAPKQNKKIPLIEPLPLDLNDFDFENLSYIKSKDEKLDINVFSSYSTKASDDEMNNIEEDVYNVNKINNTINHQKTITILDILKQKIQL